MRPLRLGEEKKEDKKIETTGQNIMACPIIQGGHKKSRGKTIAETPRRRRMLFAVTQEMRFQFLLEKC